MVSNLEYYKTFYYMAKTGSLTQAASLLSISQPAVSQALKQLEQQTNAKLFRRVSKGVKLTAEGELLYSYVAKGYEQFLLGEERLKQMQNSELGEIHIGASDMTLQFFLLPYLEQFHEKYPGIKVIVSNAPTPETIENLKKEQIDFGVVSSPLAEDPSVCALPVREIEDIFVCGRRFISYKNRTLDLSVLETLPLICLEGNTSSKHYMEDFLSKNNVSLKPEFELATSDMIIQFALRSLGIGCVVKDFALPYLQSGKLFALRFNQMIPKRNFLLVTPSGGHMSPAVENLLHLIYERNENIYD